MKISISKQNHHNEPRLKLDFGYDQALISLVKQIEGATWSKSIKAWHVPDNEETLGQLKSLLREHELLFEWLKEPNLPSVTNPETTAKEVDKNIFVEVINRKILIKMPKNEADINFIRLLKYSRWLSKEYLWQVPDYPGNIELIKDHFGNRIHTLNINRY